ncbi:MAG: LamG domain-containing protein [Candidatus Aenigmarchaeota archaeon]|jgi:hypothetical protein|nr:LamG domain-containing protein [Candidatus Aenigmarchaeota archaeon]
MSLKSISTFLASVLLIGFTIASGIIVYYFLTNLPKVQTTEISSQASKVLSCAGDTFDVKVRNCNLLNGLVLWLPMDEGSGTITYDYSGYGNNGTLYNGTNICSNPPTSGCPTWVDGKIGKALSFDGSDDYVTIGNVGSGVTSGSSNDIGSLLGNGPFTVTLWYKPISNPGSSDWDFLLDQRADINWGDGFYILNDGRLSNKILFGVADSTSSEKTVNSNTQLQVNNWYHIVALYDGSAIRIYVNGNFENSVSQTTRRSNTVGAVIGSRYSKDQKYVNGIIDEVHIYNRALSEDEIKQLYYNGLTNKFNITIGLLNFGYADLGKSFNAIVYLKNGTILQLPLVLNRDLTKGSYLEKTLTIDGYYPSYGLVDKIMVCSNDCQGVCSEIKINNQC